MATLAATLILPTSLAFSKNTSDTIKIVENNWTSQLILSRIIGNVLKSEGFKVEFVPSDGQLQFTAMGNGDMHLQMEVWEGSHHKAFSKQLKKKRMIEIVKYTAVTREDWWYPTYMEEICPGLPDWKALNKCAEKFSTLETAPKGRYLAGPADWGKPDQERIDALKLDFELVNAGTAAALTAELASAYKRKEPIVLFNWTPNWVEAKYKGKYVDFPKFNPKCHSDPSWGINKDATHDCGTEAKGYLKMAAWSGFNAKWPSAYKILKNVDFTNPQIASVALLVDVDGLTAQKAADKWMKDNKSIWTKWVK